MRYGAITFRSFEAMAYFIKDKFAIDILCDTFDPASSRRISLRGGGVLAVNNLSVKFNMDRNVLPFTDEMNVCDENGCH